ncbi:CRISPR-associated helicase Cas3' [Synechocystis sp. PCC 7339]|uniref:CRISPR-associated helicase Cas3' n=1 Tax=unclassified Synechocystis TaxID=2640012 RepID=UPI001BAE9F79|nr:MULTISPECIES: CRISPR-associated helicase Cas3' [unclassified Synechocystis]QUS60088.1 CRISPR-associated helicase Cas3' [Synechocystis sp. PCC 7338]UAJ72465.1 CRISPR-associated helicase Cas3' [Synechocystis sp. PCC 7339]
MLPKLKPDCLLAKSYEPGHWKGSYSLVGHTADVVNAVTALVDILGDRLLQQFGLTCDLDYLRNTAKLAAYLHDWGKANDHFQGMVRSKIPGTSPQRELNQHQMLRHEVVSVLLAWEFRDWLQQADGDFYTALVAAGGHHLKLGGNGGKCTDNFGEIKQSGDVEMSLYFLHPTFKSLLKYGVKILKGLPEKLKLSITPSQSWTVTDIKQKRQKIKEALEEQPIDPVLCAVIKALLVAGDCSASAFPNVTLPKKDGKQPTYEQWLKEEVTTTLDKNKLDRVIKERLAGHSLRPFQENLGNIKSRVAIARAGCGTGKTLGAYNWAKTHAIGRKLFFCYPTTGTSTEGFIDYVHGKIEAELFHSRYQVDLEMMKTGEEEELDSGSEVAIKLESFRAWGAESVVCTVDTVLGLFQCNRRPLYCFPAIANAAFVFDEIHCYDAKLFWTLLRFLTVVKAPVLLMSASILPWQKTAIEDAVGEPIQIIEGPKEIETQARYRFELKEEANWERVEQELKEGGKVLWVCNQVNTAIAVYEETKRRGLEALLYHSRYRYQDRVRHHRAVVDAFKPDQKKPIIAICTQVAEMSLDLSATLLVSQIADPAGLIQRLGRLNRRYCGHALDALFYPDEKEGFPYSSATLAEGKAMLESFTGEVNQAQLAQWLEEFTPEPKAIDDDLDLVWLDGHWRTYPASLRQAGHNITVLLEQDLPTIKTLPAKDIPKYTVPIPMNKWKPKEKYKFYPIAPTDIWSYTEEIGAKQRGGK